MRPTAHQRPRIGAITTLLSRRESAVLLIANQSSKSTRILVDVAREMSLTLTYFASAATLAELMDGHSRRIVLLTEPEISDAVIDGLESAAGRAHFGLIIAADREALRSGNTAKLLDRLTDFSNVEWIQSTYDFEQLSAAARGCRRRMLRLSRKDLENAILNREFIVQYQPKVERGSDSEWQTCEAEALLRWRHPEHGIVGPLEFLPEAEAFGLIAPISEFVLRETASQLLQWRNQNLQLNACINLATSLLANSTLPARYADIVQEIGLECSNFSFEIAEQDLDSTDAPHLRALGALRKKGFRLCLDDFRVAASSLATFEQLPFDEIKIHASAMQRAQDDPVALHVLAAVTGLAHNLGMSVCAEGVEDEDTMAFLETIACDKMQGFLVSEAVMPDIMRRTYGPLGRFSEEVA